MKAISLAKAILTIFIAIHLWAMAYIRFAVTYIKFIWTWRHVTWRDMK